ncbi:FKBP-type peptidyl-prolyl cis-trans isomerase [Parapedobacter tibetensis]|uniref:FKBP-type peptidyl-prolyl cis-trans isomerase n=1 Tax=Parapedobacter tibetensis TaxID=2972951 RepID=UPI00214D5CF1|nr:hypothetical protein [Parapedobacter tibetensis]
MKRVNVLVLGLIVAMGLSSCIKDGDPFDPDAQYQIEKPLVEAYAKAHLNSPQFHENTGIWYEVIDLGDEDSYQYKMIPHPSNPSQLVPEAPTVKANHVTRLVESNDVVESNDDEGGKTIVWNNSTVAWQAAFFPAKIRYDKDGQLLDEPFDFGGITQSGLKKGAAIKIVTPSRWAYQNASVGNIPANSPLYYEIHVVDIQEPSSGN